MSGCLPAPEKGAIMRINNSIDAVRINEVSGHFAVFRIVLAGIIYEIIVPVNNPPSNNTAFFRAAAKKLQGNLLAVQVQLATYLSAGAD